MIGQLEVSDFSGLVRQDGEVRTYGKLKPLKDLPKRAVRRLSNLERGVIACLMGLDEGQESGLGDIPIVLTSRYGAMSYTLGLLKDINANESLSPTAFSQSVHNAAVGVASQLTKNRGGHTAIAAGERSLLEGMTESYARLRDGEDQIILIFSECHLPDEYAHFENTEIDIQFAVLLKLSAEQNAVLHEVLGNGEDALRCLNAINGGAKVLSWTM